MNPDPTPLPAAADESEDVVDLTSLSTATHPAATHTSAAVPASGPPRPSDPVPGERLGQYRLLRELGSGGMGIVFEAEDEWLNRRVAVKVLRADLPAEQVARERFLREARAMAAVEHENVCTIYQVGEADGRPYMAMQLLSGESLETRLDRDPRMPTAEAARIGREIAAGLAAAHAKGLVHRDVKPANVWLEASTRRVRLLDFGLALARDNTSLTHSGFVIGTPAFMSPEQARGEPLDGRSDLFSLGIILYLMTTGERPFDGATAMVVMRNLELHQPLRVNVKRVDIPAPFSNLVMELLAKDRKDRPASAAIVADRLARPEVVRPTHLPVAPPALPADAKLSSPELPRAGWHTPYRHPGPSHSVIRIFLMIAVTSIGLALYWYFYVTNYGGLEIVPDVPDAEVHIRQNGQLKYTSVTDRQFTVRPGTYELVLVKPKYGYKLSRSEVEVNRGRIEQVRVVRDLGRR
jgi:serine/threonine protein kinase